MTKQNTMRIELNRILLSIQSKCLAGVGGVTVSMVAFQAVDPGSIPGRRILVCFSPILIDSLSDEIIHY